MIMSTPPARHNIKVVSSTVRSDHKAVLATTSVTYDRSKTSITKQFRRRTPSQHASLMNDLCSYDDSSLLAETDPEKAWNDFYATTSDWLDKYYPIRQVTITSREPPFMTPDTKFLLRFVSGNRVGRIGVASRRIGVASKSGEQLPALEVTNYAGWINQSAQRNCGNASPISLSPGRNLITWSTLVYRISTTITLPSRLIPHTKRLQRRPRPTHNFTTSINSKFLKF